MPKLPLMVAFGDTRNPIKPGTCEVLVQSVTSLQRGVDKTMDRQRYAVQNVLAGVQWREAMFLPQNCNFNCLHREILNDALTRLMAELPANTDGHLVLRMERAYSDLLEYAWRPGRSAAELYDAVRVRT